MQLQSLLNQGGPVMYVLLVMSIVALTIVLVKLIQFSRLGFRRTGFVQAAQHALERGDIAGARDLLARQASPVAAVMDAAIVLGCDQNISKGDTESEISRIGTARIRELESWLRGLSAIAHLSPLLGLLGTVMGMIVAFMDIQRVGSNVDAAVLSGGIWEALLTTAFGMAIAIPSMAAFFYLEGEVDRIKAQMKDATVRVLVHFRKAGSAGGPALLQDDAARGEGKSYGV